jgi:Flp pilus assembly protein TadG
VTSLEFALVFPMFMLLFLGTIELGRYWLTVHSLRTLAAEASRAALIDTTLGASTQDCAKAKALVGGRAPFINTSALTLCVTQTTTAGVITINVTASYPFSFVLPILKRDSGTLSETTHTAY